MPRNASTGVYTPPANSLNPATPDTVISSADWNALRDDMATALNHAPSTTRALHPTTGQVQDGAFVWGGTAGGTADALTLTLTPPITAYATGMVVRFVAAADNTSATPTLSINGVTPVVISRLDGATLAAGDIKAGSVYEVMYSGTQWRLTSITQQQLQGDDNAQSVSGASVLDLADNAKIAQFVQMTVDGASVCLPDATLKTVGPAKFKIVNNGTTDFFVRPCRKMPLQNGDFVNSAAWTLGTGWSIGAGVATKAPGAAADMSQPLATEAQKTYEITFDVTAVSGGSVRIGLTGGGADVLGTPRTTPGTYTEILTSSGNTTFVVRADSAFDGSVDNIICRRHEPSALALLRPNQSASFSLLSNANPHGVWSKWDDLGSPPKLSGDAFGLTAITTILQTSCALNDFQVLHFGRNSSNHLFAYVVEYKSTGVTVGTPTLVSTANLTLGGAYLVSIGKVIFCYGANVYLATISGTSVTISPPVSSNVFDDKRTQGVGPRHAQIGNTVIVGQAGSFQAIDCDGTTPVVGTAASIGVAPTSVIGVFSQPSSRVVCFYRDDSGTPGSPFSIRGLVATVSGTTITPHTSSGINDVDIANSYGILEFSKELYLIAYLSSTTQASVVAATVSGTSVTFHTPVSFAIYNNASLYQTVSYQNEMFQKLSDTEAVMVVGIGNSGSGLTFAHIKINGTTLTVTTSALAGAEARGFIITGKKKMHFGFFGNSVTHANRYMYSIEYTNNEWKIYRIPNLKWINRPIKINESGFIVPLQDVLSGPQDETNIRNVFVSTKADTEQIFTFFCRTAGFLWAEPLTSQKTALYGSSIPAGQILHYLVEGVC